jgi:hypothetical protein
MIILGVFGIQQVWCQEVTQDLSSIEQQLVQDALKNINQQLHNQKGIERISCCYKVIGNDPLSVSIKTFFGGYRTKPTYQDFPFKNAQALAKSTPDEVIEIIYKSHEKKQLTIVSKKHKRRSCKYVEIS